MKRREKSYIKIQEQNWKIKLLFWFLKSDCCRARNVLINEIRRTLQHVTSAANFLRSNPTLEVLDRFLGFQEYSQNLHFCVSFTKKIVMHARSWLWKFHVFSEEARTVRLKEADHLNYIRLQIIFHLLVSGLSVQQQASIQSTSK